MNSLCDLRSLQPTSKKRDTSNYMKSIGEGSGP